MDYPPQNFTLLPSEDSPWIKHFTDLWSTNAFTVFNKSRDTTSWKWHWFSQLGRRSSFKMLRFTSSNTCFRRYPSTHIEQHLYLLNFVMCVRDKSYAERNRSLVMFCMCLIISWCICSYILNTPNWLNIKVSLWKISVSSIIFKKIDNKIQW